MKHDWYQSDSHVIINVLTKNCKKEDAVIDITEKTVHVIRDTDGKREEVIIELLRPIREQEATYKIMSTKIEIRLPKHNTERWITLEAALKPTTVAPKKDWDGFVSKVEKEEGEEKGSGEGELNNLFQNIFANADPDTQRAMKKSYMESGGTVLSTNWDEVGSKTVTVQPPDGMEYKKWQG